MKHCLGVLLLVLAWSVSVPGFAATYTLPDGALPSGCTRTSSVLVTCTSLNLNNNDDTIVVTSPMTLQVNGNFNYAQNVKINQGGPASNLTFNVTGSWSGGNGGHFNASLNVANITLNQNSYVGGNLVASGTVSADTNTNQFL
ncbi:MAG TPA: hypothetical protein VNR18_11960, partial [Hyphomicrobiales bacterium]|nr:hypothetical protein [Hyphomicrobiales bacterium]